MSGQPMRLDLERLQNLLWSVLLMHRSCLALTDVGAECVYPRHTLPASIGVGVHLMRGLGKRARTDKP
jgi:hypothetical protein